MTTRSTVDKGIQLSPETTAGTQVAASKRLPNVDILWSPNVITQTYRAAGRKIPGTSVVHGADMRGTYNGILDYNAPIYPLAGLIGAEGGAPTVPGGWD